MVDPICAFLLEEQQLFPLGRLWDSVCVVSRGLFSTPLPPILWLGSWFSKEFVWADLSIRAAPMECEMQAVVGLVPFHLLTVFFGRKDWLSVLMLGVATTAFCVQGELTASWWKSNTRNVGCFLHPMIVKHLLLTDCALYLCCCTLPLFSDDS